MATEGYLSNPLSFISKKNRPRKPREFWSLAAHDVPERSGVYVLIARRKFPYPKGRSPVFYVGQAKNLRRRLRSHLTYARRARADRRLRLYWPRYEYAAAFGKRYALVLTTRGQSPHSLEKRVLQDFSRKYRTFPLANGQGTWPDA